MTAPVSFSYSDRSKESQEALNEEIHFFRDICGWSEEKIESYLGLAPQTLLQRRLRAAKKEKEKDMSTSVSDQVHEILVAVFTPDGIEAWWDTNVPALAGHTPREMLQHGDTVALLELARSYLKESFS